MEANFFVFDEENFRNILRNVVILCKNGLTPEFLVSLPTDVFQEIIQISNKLINEEKGDVGNQDEDPKSIGQLYPEKFGRTR